ncbi:hypothetical protein F5Y16DRAFT_367741 [Xylariaceae sp. FL0255]|nr:hypothetical protein F5Y16DRAFT_367741 [Xylariaceae sp. FL0255]
MGQPEIPPAATSRQQPDNGAAPPTYDAATSSKLSPEDIEQLNSAFSSLNLPSHVTDVTPDSCLAHLKLLFAFQNLKESIGYTDGLWDLFDSRVYSEGKTAASSEKDAKVSDKTREDLALLREKRWAIYVARAVDRYEAWWKTFLKSPLTEDDMMGNTTKYAQFPSSFGTTDISNFWLRNTLPPIDVLMVWHAHMLNPRAYLEDCMRQGQRELWHAGMPWKVINDAIDSKFSYAVSKDVMNRWQNSTGRQWINEDDPSTQRLPACSECGQENNYARWTTCGSPQGPHETEPSLTGVGYGDSDFKYQCNTCNSPLNKEFLSVTKFVKDVRDLLVHRYPMPGTILDHQTGKVERVPIDGQKKDQYGRTFPNRLILNHLRNKLLYPPPKSIEAVRLVIEEALKDADIIKKVENVSEKNLVKKYNLGQDAKVAIRKMMSRYWGNGSPFVLELGGAVLRQSIFTEKMYKIDWLHSPAARDTMERLLIKYKRFIDIMAHHREKIAVPTLDVDLAWHTHQLSPSSYYDFVCRRTSKFIDHDDKIEEVKLSTSFEWTSKVYQEIYNEVYSECTCWYCESVRAGHTRDLRRLSKVMPFVKTDKTSDQFYESGRATLCPPDNSAHISAHNAVQVTGATGAESYVMSQARKAHQARLEENYQKARKRAKKRGRELPGQNEYYYSYWGSPYFLYGPYVYPAYYVGPVYYSCPVQMTQCGNGTPGSCAAGSCGGTVHAGACAGGQGGSCGTSGSAVGDLILWVLLFPK